jgi:hypothetical protein
MAYLVRDRRIGMASILWPPQRSAAVGTQIDVTYDTQRYRSDQQMGGMGVSGEVRRIRRFPRLEPSESLPNGSATPTVEYSA